MMTFINALQLQELAQLAPILMLLAFPVLNKIEGFQHENNRQDQ